MRKSASDRTTALKPEGFLHLKKTKKKLQVPVLTNNSGKDCVDVQMEAIEHIMLENQHTFVDILKLDIEGSEFSVIRSLDFYKVEFGQIVVEFHERFIENGKAELNKTVDVFRENGYYCFAVSPDFEYSFLNRKIYNALFAGRG